MTIIKTERLILRPLEEKDAKKLSELGDNKKIWMNLTDSFPHPYTIENAFVWIKYNQEMKTPENFAITTNNEFIGMIGLKEQTPHTTEVGYWLGEIHWGKGYATEALRAFTKFIQENTEYIRIEAKVFTHNSASAKTLKKCGYEYEGTLRKSTLKAGKYFDEEIYSIIK